MPTLWAHQTQLEAHDNPFFFQGITTSHFLTGGHVAMKEGLKELIMHWLAITEAYISRLKLLLTIIFELARHFPASCRDNY